MNPTEDLQQKIAEYRTEVTARRARAFVDCPDYPMGIEIGIELNPITPKTWTILHATGNRLICGGGEPLEGDLRSYIWYNSPHFSDNGRFLRVRKWWALLRWNVMLHRNRGADWYVACLALMGAELTRIVHETLADAPTGGRSTSPGPCMEAQFIGLFAKEYGWSAEYTRNQPLRKLFQLRRNFDTDDDDDGERRVRFEHLRKRNEQLQKENSHA
jgi:hypothetical protein